MRSSLKYVAPVCVSSHRAILGEGPLWDPRGKRLYWLDIKGNKIFCFDPQTDQVESMESVDTISALGLARGGGFVGSCRNGFVRIFVEQNGLRIEPIFDPEQKIPGNRFNDGKVDPMGGFWAGSMDDSEVTASGSWWRLGKNGEISFIDRGFRVTNGPAFDPARGRVFITDSAKRTVFVANTDGTAIYGKKVFMQFESGDGYPDGMEVDVNGCLWIAFWDGAAVRQFSPQGELLVEITLPIPRPTSIAFSENWLYITSASFGLSDSQASQFPLSGGLFRVALARNLAPPVRYFQGE